MGIAAYVGGYLCFEGTKTNETWMISRTHNIGCFETRPLPITLFDQPKNLGHAEAIAVGAITRLWRESLDSGVVGIRWIGTISDTLEGQQAIAAISDKTNRSRNYLSADIVETQIDVEEVPSTSTTTYLQYFFDEASGTLAQRKVRENLMMHEKRVHSAFLYGATLLPIASAYPGANSQILSKEEYDAYMGNPDLPDVPEVQHETIGPWKALNASGVYRPREYDRAIFEMPEAATPTKLTVIPGTRLVQGHLGAWGTCHLGIPGCKVMPRGVSYDEFHRTPLSCIDGSTVLVGPLTLGEGHTPDDIDAKWHHENVLSAIADIRITEGVHGPWASGILRDSATEADIEALVKSHPSGEWRNNESACVAMMLVVTPGFGVKEEEKKPLKASGHACRCSELGATDMTESAELEEPNTAILTNSAETENAKAALALIKERLDKAKSA